MNKTKYIYVSYIAATAEAVWQALLEPEFTRQYWEHDNVSDWQPGSDWAHHRIDGSGVDDIVGTVISSEPPRKLVLSWASAENKHVAENHSKVTLDIDTVGTMVRLTVTHEDLVVDSPMLRGISFGWPRVLCSLKSLLETGKPLQTFAGDRACQKTADTVS